MSNRIILVTGANRGIGFAIVHLLADRAPDCTIILACRSLAKANEAIAQLESLSLKANFQSLELDVTKDDSIRNAVAHIEKQYGKLDVLVNNAAYAAAIDKDDSDFRQVWNDILNVNVTAVGLITKLLVPLLQCSTDPRVVNISSARGSFTVTVSGNMPPTANMAYTVSKTALNMLMVDMSRAYPDILFQAISPGHCKTGLNGFRGAKDPLDGAKSAVEVVLADRGAYKAGLWQWEKNGMEEVGW